MFSPSNKEKKHRELGDIDTCEACKKLAIFIDFYVNFLARSDCSLPLTSVIIACDFRIDFCYYLLFFSYLLNVSSSLLYMTGEMHLESN